MIVPSPSDRRVISFVEHPEGSSGFPRLCHVVNFERTPSRQGDPRAPHQ